MDTGTLPLQSVDIEARRALARIPIEQPPGAFGRILAWYSKRTYGQALDNGYALAHNRRVLAAVGLFEGRVKKWRSLDPTLKVLAEMAVAVEIGCSWCVDFGYYLAHSEGLDLAKLRQVPVWKQSEIFTSVERQVLEYAQAMTSTPPAATETMVAGLRRELSDAAVVELTMIIAVENQRSRFNSALGLVSQGFSESCQIR